jgi:hypothetical protein
MDFGDAFESAAYVTVECSNCEERFEVRAAESIAENRLCPACKELQDEIARLPKDCYRCGGTTLVPEFPAPTLMAADLGIQIGRICPACCARGYIR